MASLHQRMIRAMELRRFAQRTVGHLIRSAQRKGVDESPRSNDNRGMFTEYLWEGGEVSLNVASTAATAPPLLLLHGIARRWRTFDPVLTALLPVWRVFALDHRGHGRSGRAPSYTVPDYVRDTATFLRDSVTEPTVIYGHGLGAIIALALAGEMPDRVRAIVLEDPPGVSFLANLRGTLTFEVYTAGQRLAGPGHSVSEVTSELAGSRVYLGAAKVQVGEKRDHLFLRFAARCLNDLDPEVLTPFLEGQWLAGFDIEATAGTVSCPVLLLRAEDTQGGMLPREDADRLGARLADCTRVDMAGSGHLIHWLHTAALLRHLLGFLGSL